EGAPPNLILRPRSNSREDASAGSPVDTIACLSIAGNLGPGAGPVDFSRQPLPHPRAGVVARATQVVRRRQCALLGRASEPCTAHPGVDPDGFVEIDMHHTPH